MALKGAGKRMISKGLSNLTAFKTSSGSVSAKRVPRRAYSELGIGKLPTPYNRLIHTELQASALYVVYSYLTPIAWVRLDQDPIPVDAWIIPEVNYSPTTTNHQNIVGVEIAHPGFYADTRY